jgi:ferredoxin/flavodoxin---NADP+ reductase
VSHHDVVIIGGGPAGLSTATYARQRGLAPLLLEAETFGGQLVNLYPTKPVDNFPAQPELASRDLARRLADQAAHFGAELRELAPVDFVGRRGHRFTVRTAGDEIEADAVVLALGLGRFTPRTLGLESERRYLGRGLTYRLPPRERIEAARVVVVGGGDSAVDTALSLHEIADATLVHRGSALSAYGRSQERLAASGVRVLLDAEVVGLGGDDRLEHVLVSIAEKESVEVPADLVLVSIGQVPDLRGARAWEIPLDDCHVAVDPAMTTRSPGVFAAGDLVDYTGKVRMIATAVAEGSTAAAAVERFLMAGGLAAA